MTDKTAKPTILIIDDAMDNIKVLGAALKPEYRVLFTLRAQEGIDSALANRPDLILLDVLMPEMNGYEVCRRLKTFEETKDIPVIFITSRTSEEHEQRGLDLGAADYIHKPFSPSLVKARLRNHLELKRHRDHLEDLVNERTEEVSLIQNTAIYSLGILAEYRDVETGDHIRRTRKYIQLISAKIKDHPGFAGYFDQTTMRLLFNSAPLHDIGKVGVPDSILLKPGALTKEEFDAMKQHTRIGRDIIIRTEEEMNNSAATAFLRFTKELTYTHHERWDGTGYHGLKGDEIPVSGRLMALADIYDALTSARVYKEAYSHEKAVSIIAEGDGRTRPEHFDPLILQAFLDIGQEINQARLNDGEN